MTSFCASRSLEERRRKDAHIRHVVATKLEETGEKDRLKGVLRERLIECGWFDDLKRHCREVIKSKGLERITVDALVEDVTPKGRGPSAARVVWCGVWCVVCGVVWCVVWCVVCLSLSLSVCLSLSLSFSLRVPGLCF